MDAPRSGVPGGGGGLIGGSPGLGGFPLPMFPFPHPATFLPPQPAAPSSGSSHSSEGSASSQHTWSFEEQFKQVRQVMSLSLIIITISSRYLVVLLYHCCYRCWRFMSCRVLTLHVAYCCPIWWEGEKNKISIDETRALRRWRANWWAVSCIFAKDMIGWVTLHGALDRRWRRRV